MDLALPLAFLSGDGSSSGRGMEAVDRTVETACLHTPALQIGSIEKGLACQDRVHIVVVSQRAASVDTDGRPQRGRQSLRCSRTVLAA